MIVSNEPGYYKKNEYGIRIENLLICMIKNNKTLYFENISWAPIDIDLIEKSLLSSKEKEWLNYKLLKDGEYADWLSKEVHSSVGYKK